MSTTTRAQRINARHEKIWAEAARLKTATRFNLSSREVKIWDVNTRRTRIVKMHGEIATCGDCGRSWDDSIVTGMTPTPSGRCPFEGMRRLSATYRRST